MIQIPIQTAGHSYDALIENGLLRTAGACIRERMPSARNFVIITVAPVRRHYGKVIAQSFTEAGLAHHILEMPDGERSKTFSTVEDLASRMVKLGADRSSAVVALGGGVTGDVAGFLASIYMRGVPYAQVPTTLLAQIDSAIGGKTGVNLREGKNLIGAFHQPELVLADPTVLTTLPEREFRAGLFEALKAGVIANAQLFRFMEDNRDRILQRDAAALESLIGECVRVKANVVSQDEREHGLRRILNFGHTIGHALESDTGYKHFLHGEAVAWGMIAATMISVGMQKLGAPDAQRIISAVLAYASLPKVDVKPRNIAKLLARDKKTVGGKVHFILPTQIGQVVVEDQVPERAVLQAIEELRYLSQA